MEFQQEIVRKAMISGFSQKIACIFDGFLHFLFLAFDFCLF